jgi:hypothetical protein
VSANVLRLGDRVDGLVATIENIIDPPPQRSTLPTVVVTPAPTAEATAVPTVVPSASATPSPTPLVRAPVDVALVEDHATVFASQLTEKDCAVAGTQMVLAILGLGDTSDAFQHEIKDRIGEWEAYADSQNGGWGPAAVGLALADYGAIGYEVRAYETYSDALRDSAIAISTLEQPVVMFPWWPTPPSSPTPRSPARTSSTRGTRASPPSGARLTGRATSRTSPSWSGTGPPTRATRASVRAGPAPRGRTPTATVATSSSSRRSRATRSPAHQPPSTRSVSHTP